MDPAALPILRFTGTYRFLSNFYPVEVELDGETYPSVEHAFQAAKTAGFTGRRIIRNCRIPSEAKRLGGLVTLRENWEEIKIDVMTNLVMQKFSRHPELREKLLATGDGELVEGNWWSDTFWGVCKGKGENHLGKILMETRRNLGGC